MTLLACILRIALMVMDLMSTMTFISLSNGIMLCSDLYSMNKQMDTDVMEVMLYLSKFECYYVKDFFPVPPLNINWYAITLFMLYVLIYCTEIRYDSKKFNVHRVHGIVV